MNTIVQTLRRELLDLEADLRADPRHQKISHIKELLALYGEAVTTDASAQSSDNLTPPPRRGNGTHLAGSRKSTKTIRMEQGVVELLAKSGESHRQVILDYLNSHGIMGGEKNPMGHLAAFLSDHRHVFASDGRGNFRLVETSNGGAQSTSAGSEEPAENHPIGA
jgi:hypothetical protein